MKTTPLLLCVGVICVGVVTAGAQVAIPTTPKGFTKRGTDTGKTTSSTSNGGAISIGGGTAPAAPAKVRYTTHIALGESRQWQSSDGKSLVGKLIAFEDITIETLKGAPAPTFTPPPNPTVVKDGKVRLLVGTTAYELPLDRLSEADREFVEKARAAMAAKAGAGGGAGAGAAPGVAGAGAGNGGSKIGN